MKKRVSSPVVAPAGFSKILDFGASTTEEAMNSVTGQQTADPTNAPSSFSSSSSSLFLGLSTKLLLSVLYGCFSSLAGISPLATSSSRRRGGRRGGGEFVHTREPRHRFVIHLHDAFQGDRELLNTFRRGTIEPPESRSPEDVPLRGRRIGGEDLLERSLCLIFWIFV